MINAKQANKQATDNFVPNLKANEKMLHFYIEAKIRERSEKGYYGVRIHRGDVDNFWYSRHGELSIVRLHKYYQELGYIVSINYNIPSNTYIDIDWGM